MGIRTGSGLNPELPPLVVDEGLLNALRGNHRDDPETFRVLKRIKLARTCFKDAYEVHSLPLGCTFDQLNRLHAPHCIPQVAVYSSQWVEECIMSAIARVRTEHQASREAGGVVPRGHRNYCGPPDVLGTCFSALVCDVVVVDGE